MRIDRLASAQLAACAVATVLAAALCACGQENRYVAPPPPKVTVAIPVQQKVTRYLEATGYTAAINTTSLVARVQGFLQKITTRRARRLRKERRSSSSSPSRTGSSSSGRKPRRLPRKRR
jgi:multidrug efflux pump subunit AcrA (membrane-fusion protein)